jgi:hypothetical protein
VDRTDLEANFHREMLRVYENVRRTCGYRPTRFRRMVLQHGGSRLRTGFWLVTTIPYPQAYVSFGSRAGLT